MNSVKFNDEYFFLIENSLQSRTHEIQRIALQKATLEAHSHRISKKNILNYEESLRKQSKTFYLKGKNKKSKHRTMQSNKFHKTIMAQICSLNLQVPPGFATLQHTLHKVHLVKIQRIAIIIDTTSKKEYKLKCLTQSQSRVRQKPQGTNSMQNSRPSVLSNTK